MDILVTRLSKSMNREKYYWFMISTDGCIRLAKWRLEVTGANGDILDWEKWSESEPYTESYKLPRVPPDVWIEARKLFIDKIKNGGKN